MNAKADVNPSFEYVDPLIDPLLELEASIRKSGTERWWRVGAPLMMSLLAGFGVWINFKPMGFTPNSSQLAVVLMVLAAFLSWTNYFRSRRIQEDAKWRQATVLMRTLAEELKELRAARR